MLAIFLGVTSAEGSPLQLIQDPPGSAAMTGLPFSLVPSFLVPFYLIIHAVIWMKLANTRRSSTGQRDVRSSDQMA